MINRNKRVLFLILFTFFVLTVAGHFFGIPGKPGITISQKPGPGKKDTSGATATRVIVKFKKGASKNMNLKKVKHIRLIDAYVYEVPAGETAPGLAKKLASDSSVLYAEPDFLLTAFSTMPNDAFFGDLWGMHNTGQSGGTPGADIKAPEAWDHTTGSSGVLVAVIDTGVDYNHPDLADNIWTNPGEIPGDGIDNDGNGYVDDVHGINAITAGGDPVDDNGHGTHVSGTIGARGNNSIGVAGVCWTVKIMPLKFLNASGNGLTDDAITCIEYAIAKGATILSSSWGGGGYSQALRDAIEAAKNAGILFVAAAGNWGTNNDGSPIFPASYDNENIIAVAATDHNDALASFSCYGATTVDVAAPGVDILSTIPEGAYDYDSGTSMAAPHVSGLAALLKAYRPSGTWSEIKSRILAGVDNITGLNGLIMTGGRVNALNSLLIDVSSPHVFYLNPPAGPPSAAVKIKGFSFGPSQGTGYVEFAGGLQATVSSWSDGEIDCIVPEEAQTGELRVRTNSGAFSNVLNFRIIPSYYSESLISNEFQGAGTALHFNVDDFVYNYPLPFAFTFFGTKYPAGSTIRICSNGYIDFASSTADYVNSSVALRANVRIAPLWMDLNTQGTGQSGEDIYVTAKTKTLTIRWSAETYLYAEPVNFEVVLSADGRIKFNYGSNPAVLHSYITPGPTIGISGGQCDYFYSLSQYDNTTNLNMAQTDLFTPLNLPTIEVTSPDATSVWLKGTNQQIVWTTSGAQSPNVKIQLRRNSTKVRDISTTTPNDGSFNWKVPTGLAAASNYFIRVITVDNLVLGDSSLFTITGPKVTVTAPDSSSVWQRGTTQTILWTKLGSQAQKVNIVLRRNNVKCLDIAVGAANNGSFSWKIPGNLGALSGYVVRVKTTDGLVSGNSAAFAISAPTLTVTSPSSSSSWARGSSQTITWTISGVINVDVTIQLWRGTTKVMNVATVAAGAGSYNWTIPSVTSGSGYFIRIRAVDSSVSADSQKFLIN